MRNRTALVTVVLLLLADGCGNPAETQPASNVSSPIVGGTQDTQHQAVVAVVSSTTLCSGTIVAVSGTTGYVLTAAHCLSSPMEKVVQADTVTTTALSYAITSQVADPSFDPNDPSKGHDFGIVTFANATGSTPVIPIVDAPDGLDVGVNLDLVGFGATAPTSSGGKRYAVTVAISQLDSNVVQFDQTNNKGECVGDAGGPALVTQGGVEKVAAVMSFGDANCNQYGAAARVTSDLDSFIVANIGQSGDAGNDAASGGAAGTTGTGGVAGTGGAVGTGASGGSPPGGSGGQAGAGVGGSNPSSNGSDSSGCGCRMAERPRPGSALALLALGLVGLRRRRRSAASR